MMKKILLLIGLFCYFVFALSQDKEIYARFQKQTEQLTIQQVLSLGDSYANEEKKDTAILLYTIAINRFNNDMPKTEKELCAVSHLRAGNIYYAQGNYISAMNVFIKGLEISESCDFYENTIKLYNNIGNIYFLFQDLEKAAMYYEKGYALCNRCVYPEAEFKLLNNLTSAYCYIPNNDKAKFYFKKMTKLADRSSTFADLFNYQILSSEGLILLNDKEYRKAASMLKKSIDFARQKKMGIWYECASYEELYKVYDKLNDRDSMMYYLHLLHSLAKENGFTDKLIGVLKVLSLEYEKEDDIKNAQLYKGEYLKLADSIYNFREFSRIKNVQFVYETDKYNKEMTTLQALQLVKERELKIQRIILVCVLVGLFFILILLAIVYNQKRKLGRSYENLFQVNNEIVASEKYNKKLRMDFERQLQTKELIIKELQDKYESNPLKKDEKTDIKQYLESSSKMKYVASNLNEGQKGSLLDAINSIMENTQEYCEMDFSLDKLSNLVNSNSKYVSQVINETYHKNFNSFVNEYRIREARRRLTDIEQYGNYTIQTISESVGYKSSTTFINVFRKITGITPSMYQRMVREQKNLQIHESTN